MKALGITRKTDHEKIVQWCFLVQYEQEYLKYYV